jgi:hypothetical protein
VNPLADQSLFDFIYYPKITGRTGGIDFCGRARRRVKKLQ